MEKKKPTHNLQAFKKVFVSPEKLSATGVAYKGAAALACTKADMVEVIQMLQNDNFRKSMTSYHNHKEWQDVYTISTRFGNICLKL